MMINILYEKSKPSSLKQKLIVLAIVATLPFFLVSVYLLLSLLNYSHSYDAIVSNLTVANDYNLDFRETLDESIYRLVAGSITLADIDSDESLQDPYALTGELRERFTELEKVTQDRESRMWLQSLLRNLETLELRIDDIKQNLDEGGHYDENMEMLDHDIYVLTDLVQEDIQRYIYYQTENMELLKHQLNDQVQTFTIAAGILIVIVLIVVLGIMTQIMYGILNPVQRLRKMTGQVAQGDFAVRAPLSGPTEIAELAGSVNDMTLHLEAMVGKIKEDERKMRHAELRLLQEQINPHFLYNTLDTIVWLIEGNSSDEAVDMVVSLSQFFRLVLSHGKEYISIREEEQHISSYLKIQQARYHDILDYEIQIDPSIYPYKILKLTLQPLVENALYHGIKYKRAMGKITVTGTKQGENILLTVNDNGVGMEEEQLAHLRQSIERPCKDTDGGFGLANVNERIRMNFGENYGMRIESEAGAGTTVMVTIPAEQL